MSTATILLVDDDEVLSQVLRRVLTREGYTVLEAGTVAQALQLARDPNVVLGLLDLCLPDGDGMDLARQLNEQGARFPLILMTAYPLRLREQPELAAGFTRVLTKPLNLQEVRQAIATALSSPAARSVSHPEPAHALAESPILPAPASEPEFTPPAAPPPVASHAPEPPRRRLWPVAVGVALVVGIAFAAYTYSPQILQIFKPSSASAAYSVPSGAKLVENDPFGIELDPETVRQMKLTTEPVKNADKTRPLVLVGSLNYDPDYLGRARTLFPGSVVEITRVPEAGRSGRTEDRPLTFGDRVEKGQLLAVVWSKDLGEKKSELVDNSFKLKIDEDLLRRYEDLLKDRSIPEASVRVQRSQVALERSAVNRAERTLRIWKVPDDEIKAVYDEAEKIYERQGKHDPKKEESWARVEIRAPFSGTIVEKNVALGDIVDSTIDLFKVADLTKIAVWANAYEEDLRILRTLPRPIPWDVRTTDGTERTLKCDYVDRFSASIDPNQHTALVFGQVDNVGEKLVGQFVTATVQLPVPPNTVAVPTSALVEDGDESVVFVQPDPAQTRYSMRRVLVVQRMARMAYLRTGLTKEEKDRGLQEVHVGELVVTQRALALTDELRDLLDKKKNEKEAGK
jgi:cobalt-zinc-cadmium efflux system membrane fusion protein